MSNMSQEEIDRLLNGAAQGPDEEKAEEKPAPVDSGGQETTAQEPSGGAQGPVSADTEGPAFDAMQEQAPPNSEQGMGEIRSMKSREQQAPRREGKGAHSSRYGKKKGAPRSRNTHGNIGMIIDMPLLVTVELGKVHMSIKEILAFTLGSIIELDRSADDLADVKVNGKLIARGEIVVVDENYGVRVTNIVSPESRLKG